MTLERDAPHGTARPLRNQDGGRFSTSVVILVARTVTWAANVIQAFRFLLEVRQWLFRGLAQSLP